MTHRWLNGWKFFEVERLDENDFIKGYRVGVKSEAADLLLGSSIASLRIHNKVYDWTAAKRIGEKR